ncbi:MAG: hypothetical protein JXR78_12910 [Victivallales bacterium]|nr:hypothetical protein [Victivallales bacterium]
MFFTLPLRTFLVFNLLFYVMMDLCSMPPQTFYLSFDKGLNADFAIGDAVVVKNSDTAFVPGLSGQALHIGEDGVLCYRTKGNISAAAGTLSVWIKLDWTPAGSGCWPDRTAGKEPFRKTYHGLFFASDSLKAEINTALKYGFEYFIINQIFAHDWNHYAFTWENNVITAFLNGRMLSRAKYSEKTFGELLSLGSSSSRNLGLNGAMDELNIYDKALSADEIMKLYCRYFPVNVELMDYAAEEGKPTSFRMRFINHSGDGQEKNFRLVVKDSQNGKFLSDESFTIRLKEGESLIRKLEFTPPKAGEYRVAMSCNSVPMASWDLIAIPSKRISDSMPLSETGEVRMKLIESIDCTRDYPDDKYRDDGHCRVTSSKAGTYRESSLRKINSGFAYRVKVKNIGHPHWLEIEYPDDCDRMFFVAVYPYTKYFDRVMSNGNLDTIGVISGGEHPVSHTMQRKRLLFWPDSTELMVVCGSYSSSEAPVALAKINVYENEGSLPALKMHYPEGLPRRVAGIWQEDPTMEAYNWFNRPECYPRINLDFWRIKAERMVQYQRFMGIGQWSFLVMDYFGDKTGLNYQLYSSYISSFSGYIPGWSDVLSRTFDREGIPFMVELNHRYRFEKKLSEGSMGAVIGEEHYSRNLPDALNRGERAIEQFSGTGKFKLSSLNPLHPIAQEGWLKMIRAYRDKFGIYQQFRGINIISPVQLCFDNADSGVGDWNIAAFEKDNGIKIPVDPKSPQRMQMRLDWLKKNAWNQWLDWRCAKIRDFYVRMLAELNAGTSGRMILARMIIPSADNYISSELASGRKAKNLHELYRECGVDLTMLGKVDGLLVMPEIAPNRSRVMPERSDDESYYVFSPELTGVFERGGKASVLIARHCNLEVYWTVGKTLIKSLWWKTGTFIYDNMSVESYSTAYPNNRYVMEHMAWALAEIDPVLIDHGWWGCPENGSPELFQPFYQAYQSIPALDFARGRGSNDPVALRYLNSSSGNWFYLVNKSSSPLEIAVNTGRPDISLSDVVSSMRYQTANDGKFKLKMKGFEVRVFRSSAPLDKPAVGLMSASEDILRVKETLVLLNRQLQIYEKIFGGKDEAVIRIIRSAEDYFKAGKYCLAEHRLRSRAIKRMQEELACNLKYTMTSDGKLRLSYVNINARPVSGSIRIRSSNLWQISEPNELVFKDLKPGECFTGTVSFNAPYLAHDCKYRFGIEVALDGENATTRTIEICPYLSMWNNGQIKIDADLSDWSHNTSWYKLDSERHLLTRKPMHDKSSWQAKFAWNWTRDGLCLAVVVKDKEAVFPAERNASMWMNDSLQIYLDPRNNKSRNYDSDDLVFQVAMVDGKAAAWCEHGSDNATGEVEAEVRRDGNKTVYEIFFSRKLLSGLDMNNDSMAGFSLLVNNRDMGNDGEVFSCLSPSKQSPYLNPAAWRDLLLITENPVRATAYVYGQPVPAAGASGTRIFPIG